MRMCKIKKKALRNVRTRKIKVRMHAKKQAKFYGQESEKIRISRMNQLLNKIRKEKTV